MGTNSSRVHQSQLSCDMSSVSVRSDNSQGCTADVKETPPSPEEKMAKGSMESFDSGVSFKSDRSKDRLIHFKDSVSLSGSDLSSFEKEHDVADDGFLESSDDRMTLRRTQSEPFESNFVIALRQQSPPMMVSKSVDAFGSGLCLINDSFIRTRQRALPRMVLRSMDAFGSGLSLISDSFIRTQQRSLPRKRDEMIQELSSEVGWKHR